MNDTEKEPLNFRSMILEEDALLDGRQDVADAFGFAAPGSADEPWVAFTPKDRVGLAFSGGGIRSATFNLGLLQGLQRLKLLHHFDYLATVSGGGYIGAWWSVWLARRPEGAGIFPGHDKNGDRLPQDVSLKDATKPNDQNRETREPEEVRHLREFSNFLSPRLSFFESETWGAVLAILSAMVPALLVAAAVIATALLCWLVLAMLVMMPSGLAGDFGAGLVTTALILVVQFFAERVWCGKRKAENCDFTVKHWWWMLIICGLAAFASWWLVGVWGWLGSPSPGLEPRPKDGEFLKAWATHLWTQLGVGGNDKFEFNPRIFIPSLAWVLAALFFLVPRILLLRAKGEQREWRAHIATADRVLQRLLAAALGWALIAAVWLLGAWLHKRTLGIEVTGGAVASGGMFALLRNWFVNQLSSTKKSGPLARLKPLLPQLLAYGAMILGMAGVAAGIAAGLALAAWSFWLCTLGISLLVLLFCIYFFDPALISMHAFYRNRLARAYLGASNRDLEVGKMSEKPNAAWNRQVDLRKSDDWFLHQLKEARGQSELGPLHLVCCAANNLADDTLGTLARGSRSAVLSPLGFAIGDNWSRWVPENDACNVTVASAITASAAAFNSNMGSLSMSLGPAVTFLMTALNLRLGLWLKHPLVAGTLGAAPGWLFLCEMFSITRCGTPTFSEVKAKPQRASQSKASQPWATKKSEPKPQSEFVHLSDGAHFENLALYELVRRHCRYIIVSDCGADATVAFDDFGNAMRRIREDFGVEIDIDLAPLRPDEVSGRSRQHMVAGTLYYDRERNDTGTLLYLKPTLTGDEPCDVTQYRTRNDRFPHEATGDQFYDEAQWESYRRLGEHAVQAALRFVERMDRLGGISADEFFAGARQEWYPGPADLEERVVDAMDRVGALERRLRDVGNDALRHELFPELGAIERNLEKVEKGQAGTKAPTDVTAEIKQAAADAPTAVEIEQNLPVVLEVFRIMQSIWLSCHLDTHWSHPLNLGLFNLFQRWAYAPSCRLWWPLLRPMHGSRFRRFMEEHLALADKDHPEVQGRVEGPFDEPPEGLAWMHWLRSRPPRDPPPPGSKFCHYVIGLPVQMDGSVEVKVVPMQLGVVAMKLKGETVKWSSDDFFVPPSLWGSGTGGVFLTRLLSQLENSGYKKFVVHLKEQDPNEQRSDFSSRQERNDLIAFYKRARFSLDRKTPGHMVRMVPPPVGA